MNADHRLKFLKKFRSIQEKINNNNNQKLKTSSPFLIDTYYYLVDRVLVLRLFNLTIPLQRVRRQLTLYKLLIVQNVLRKCFKNWSVCWCAEKTGYLKKITEVISLQFVLKKHLTEWTVVIIHDLSLIMYSNRIHLALVCPNIPNILANRPQLVPPIFSDNSVVCLKALSSMFMQISSGVVYLSF